MKIYAQSGFGPKDKLEAGLNTGFIKGVVLSPRYLTPERMRECTDNLGRIETLYMDPEFMAIGFLSHPDRKLGYLEQWPYFKKTLRAELIAGTGVEDVLRSALQTQIETGFHELVAPNVYVKAPDSIDAAIALSFVTKTKSIADEIGQAPVFASLAIHRDALLERDAFREILSSLTAVKNPPDGYYLILGSNEVHSSGTRSDLYEPRVIAGWMYTNYVLSINGARILNGYCELLGPLMGICGAEGSAFGWFSGLRKYCIDRYIQQAAGGRFPLVRYISSPLLSRIKQTDYATYKDVVPDIANGLDTDSAYDQDEPSRTEEMLQSWQALSELSREHCTGDIVNDLAGFVDRIDKAKELWSELQGKGFSGIEPNLERLDAMKEGIILFRELAEVS